MLTLSSQDGFSLITVKGDVSLTASSFDITRDSLTDSVTNSLTDSVTLLVDFMKSDTSTLTISTEGFLFESLLNLLGLTTTD